MSSPNSSDQSLILEVRSGSQQAAAALYERYAPRILGLVSSQMNDALRAQVEPQDIVQSIFKSLFRGVSAGKYDAPEGGTLWQLMAVVAIHKVRRNGAKRHALKRDSRRTHSIDALEGEDFVGKASPEEFEAALFETTECLKPAEKSVVLLRVQGFTVEEISQRTERSHRSVERLLQSARERLAKVLSDDEELD
ncbi:MAG: RNA polymerase sigma factor [Pirellula sp.]|jgi:RNA polymerase sigma-70 factor (ECF subfamily)|nr:RNA polymerase sigma factor [Pirellula sp.]